MRILKSILLTSACVLALAINASAAVTVGQPAPDFSLQDSNEEWHKLSDFRGKYVVLEWINFDCPFVKKHYDSGNMQGLQKEFSKKGVVWLAINSSAHGKQGHFHPDEANELIAQKGAAPTAYLMDFDGKVGQKYGAKTTPHMYVIDPAGKLIYQGAIDSKSSPSPADIPSSTNYVSQALAQAMGKKAVNPSVTPPYGCSVKY